MFNGFVFFVLLFTGFCNSLDLKEQDFKITSSVTPKSSHNSTKDPDKLLLQRTREVPPVIKEPAKCNSSQVVQRTLELLLSVMNKNMKQQVQTSYLLNLLVKILEKNVDTLDGKEYEAMNKILNNLESSQVPVIVPGDHELRVSRVPRRLVNNKSFCAQALSKILEVTKATYLELLYGPGADDLNSIKSKETGRDLGESSEKYPVSLTNQIPLEPILTIRLPSDNDKIQEKQNIQYKPIPIEDESYESVELKNVFRVPVPNEKDINSPINPLFYWKPKRLNTVPNKESEVEHFVLDIQYDPNYSWGNNDNIQYDQDNIEMTTENIYMIENNHLKDILKYPINNQVNVITDKHNIKYDEIESTTKNLANIDGVDVPLYGNEYPINNKKYIDVDLASHEPLNKNSFYHIIAENVDSNSPDNLYTKVELPFFYKNEINAPTFDWNDNHQIKPFELRQENPLFYDSTGNLIPTDVHNVVANHHIPLHNMYGLNDNHYWDYNSNHFPNDWYDQHNIKQYKHPVFIDEITNTYNNLENTIYNSNVNIELSTKATPITIDGKYLHPDYVWPHYDKYDLEKNKYRLWNDNNPKIKYSSKLPQTEIDNDHLIVNKLIYKVPKNISGPKTIKVTQTGSTDEIMNPYHYNDLENSFYNTKVNMELTTITTPITIDGKLYPVYDDDDSYNSDKNANYTKSPMIYENEINGPTFDWNYNNQIKPFESRQEKQLYYDPTGNLVPTDGHNIVANDHIHLDNNYRLNDNHYLDYNQNNWYNQHYIKLSKDPVSIDRITNPYQYNNLENPFYNSNVNIELTTRTTPITIDGNYPHPDYVWPHYDKYDLEKNTYSLYNDDSSKIKYPSKLLKIDIVNGHKIPTNHNQKKSVKMNYISDSETSTVTPADTFDQITEETLVNPYPIRTDNDDVKIVRPSNSEEDWKTNTKNKSFIKNDQLIYYLPSNYPDIEDEKNLVNPVTSLNPYNLDYLNKFGFDDNDFPSFYKSNIQKDIIETSTRNLNALKIDWIGELSQNTDYSEDGYKLDSSENPKFDSLDYHNKNTSKSNLLSSNEHNWRLDIEVTTKYSIILHEVPENDFSGNDNFYPYPIYNAEFMDLSNTNKNSKATELKRPTSFHIENNNGPINAIPYKTLFNIKSILGYPENYRTTKDDNESEESTRNPVYDTLDIVNNTYTGLTRSKGNPSGLNIIEASIINNDGLEPEPEVIKLIEETITNIEKNVDRNTDPKILEAIEKLKVMIKETNISIKNYIWISQIFHEIIEYFKPDTDIGKVMTLPYLYHLINKNSTQKIGDNVVETSYLIKSSKPIVIYQYYYVKYHVTVTEINQLLSHNPDVSSDDENLHIMLLKSSKIVDLSPALKNVSKEDVDKLTVRHGNLIKTNLLNSEGTIIPLQGIHDYKIERNNTDTDATRTNTVGNDNIKEVRIKVNNKPYHTITTISDFKGTSIIEDKDSPRIDLLNDLSNPFRKIFPMDKLIKATEQASSLRQLSQTQDINKTEAYLLRKVNKKDHHTNYQTRGGQSLTHITTANDPNEFEVNTLGKKIGEVVPPIRKANIDQNGKTHKRVGEQLNLPSIRKLNNDPNHKSNSRLGEHSRLIRSVNDLNDKIDSRQGKDFVDIPPL